MKYSTYIHKKLSTSKNQDAENPSKTALNYSKRGFLAQKRI